MSIYEVILRLDIVEKERVEVAVSRRTTDTLSNRVPAISILILNSLSANYEPIVLLRCYVLKRLVRYNLVYCNLQTITDGMRLRGRKNICRVSIEVGTIVCGSSG